MSAALKKEYLTLIERFPLAPIRSRERYEAAVGMLKELTVPERIESLTPEENDYLDVLAQLISRFEQAHWQPLAKPMTAREVLAFLLKESGTTQSELARATGSGQSHISEFLAGKRDLSKENIIKIASYFKVSPSLFLK
ncbi:MAG TPA: helix-turn-helix domain-containing protein [Candidatus Obscuribacterales bacterium]